MKDLRTSSTHLLCVGLAVLAAVVAVRLAPAVLGDDAAITLRYAERLAQGRGFSYNDHERVLGTSSPLYTLLLALSAWLGASVEGAARAFGTLFFAATVGLAAGLGARLGGRLAALAVGACLLAELFFRVQMLCGLEVGLSLALGLLAILLLAEGRDRAAGLVLGLAVWNKLDAGLLAIAAACACTIARRRFPFGVAAHALLVVGPWLLFATLYFGSPVPRSVTVKLHEGTGIGMDHGWILDFLFDAHRYLLVLAAGALAVVSARLDPGARIATLALFTWLVLHGAAASVVNLGAPYPWYLTALIPPLVILASAFAARALAASPWSWWWRPPTAIAWIGLGLFVLTTGRATLPELLRGPALKPWEAFDGDRRAAGEFLRRHADPREVVECVYGWVAFASKLPVVDAINTRRSPGPTRYRVEHGRPYARGSHAPLGPEGYIPIARFDEASRRFPGYSWFVVFADPSSRLARAAERAGEIK